MVEVFRVVVCAWCEPLGRSLGSAREPYSRDWHDVPLTYVRAHQDDASHGLCPVCRPAVALAWSAERAASASEARQEQPA